MRSWITAICVFALLLYAGWVLDHHHRKVGATPQVSMDSLQMAFDKAGGRLEAVRFALVAPIIDPALPGRIQERLGWQGASPKGEFREARLHTENGMYYLSLTWRLTGEPAVGWVAKHTALIQALESEGVTTPMHVQLEGTARGENLLALVNAGLDGVSALARQPWSSDRSASVAGRTALLPSGPHEVNIQVAARRVGPGVKLWVAWPAMSGDY